MTVPNVGTTVTASFAIPVSGPVVSGVVFDDANGNGVKDANETGDPLRGVYADYNDNGVLDVGEPSAATDDGGVYFLDVPTDQAFTLRATSGYFGGPTGTQSATRYALKFVAATKQTGLNFGLFASAQTIA